MNNRWFKGMSEDDKKEFKADLYAAYTVLNRLAEILEDDLDKSHEEATKKDNYFMPAWGEYQADKLGEQRCIRKILNLIDIEDK